MCISSLPSESLTDSSVPYKPNDLAESNLYVFVLETSSKNFINKLGRYKRLCTGPTVCGYLPRWVSCGIAYVNSIVIWYFAMQIYGWLNHQDMQMLVLINHDCVGIQMGNIFLLLEEKEKRGEKSLARACI